MNLTFFKEDHKIFIVVVISARVPDSHGAHGAQSNHTIYSTARQPVGEGIWHRIKSM